MFETLDDTNWLLYAARAYDTPFNITAEFEEDSRRLKYVKRLLKRYRSTGTISERLVLNHLVVLRNVFGDVPTTRLLFLRIDEEDYPALKTFISFLGFLPRIIKGIRGVDLDALNIPWDPKMVRILRQK